MKKLIARGLFFLVCFTVAIVAGNVWNPAEAKPFYAGRTMVVVVPTNPGGGYDFYARALAKLMQEHLPGSTIIVKNIPGAGHAIGMNEIYLSKPDGLTFGIVNPGLIATQIAGRAGVRYDLARMSWLGATGMSPYALIVAPKKFKTIEDVMKAKQVILANAGSGSLNSAVTIIANNLGIYKAKIMMGYMGSQTELAMMQGSVDGQWASWSSIGNFVREGHAVPVLFVGSKPAGYNNVPNLSNYVKDRKYAPLLEFLETISSTLVRGFVGPPGIPQDRLQILREAFRKVVTSVKYEEMMKKARSDAGFIDAGQTEKLVKNALNLDPEFIGIIKSSF